MPSTSTLAAEVVFTEKMRRASYETFHLEVNFRLELNTVEAITCSVPAAIRECCDIWQAATYQSSKLEVNASCIWASLLSAADRTILFIFTWSVIKKINQIDHH